MIRPFFQFVIEKNSLLPILPKCRLWLGLAQLAKVKAWLVWFILEVKTNIRAPIKLIKVQEKKNVLWSMVYMAQANIWPLNNLINY